MPNFANKDDREQAQPSEPPATVTADLDARCCGGVLRGRLALFIVIALTGALADLLTKAWVFRLLGPADGIFNARLDGKKFWIWEPFFALELSLNQGALFGLGQGLVWLFALLAVVAGCGIVYWLFIRGEARDLWLCIAMALVMGGIIGNLYDRLGLPGMVEVDPQGQSRRIYAVRDWILVKYDAWHWPNFNVADSLLVCGAGMLLIQVFFRPDPKH